MTGPLLKRKGWIWFYAGFNFSCNIVRLSRHSKSNPIERLIFELVIYVKQTLKIHYQILEARVTSALSVAHARGGTPIHYLHGYVPPIGVVILKLLI